MNTTSTNSVEHAAAALVTKAVIGFLAVVGFFTVTAVSVIAIIWFFGEVLAG